MAAGDSPGLLRCTNSHCTLANSGKAYIVDFGPGTKSDSATCYGCGHLFCLGRNGGGKGEAGKSRSMGPMPGGKGKGKDGKNGGKDGKGGKGGKDDRKGRKYGRGQGSRSESPASHASGPSLLKPQPKSAAKKSEPAFDPIAFLKACEERGITSNDTEAVAELRANLMKPEAGLVELQADVNALVKQREHQKHLAAQLDASMNNGLAKIKRQTEQLRTAQKNIDELQEAIEAKQLEQSLKVRNADGDRKQMPPLTVNSPVAEVALWQEIDPSYVQSYLLWSRTKSGDCPKPSCDAGSDIGAEEDDLPMEMLVDPEPATSSCGAADKQQDFNMDEAAEIASDAVLAMQSFKRLRVAAASDAGTEF